MVFRILNFSIFFCHCLVGVTKKSTSKLESFQLVENSGFAIGNSGIHGVSSSIIFCPLLPIECMMWDTHRKKNNKGYFFRISLQVYSEFF